MSLLRQLRVYWRAIRPHARRLKTRVLAGLIRVIPNESQRVFALTLLIGAVCGLAAVFFHLSIITAESLLIGDSDHSPTGWLVAMPIAGGALSGILLRYVFPDARGSGIPQVKAAYEIKGGRLPLKDAVGKYLVSVIQIGSGASLGREGPTVHICACISSFFGRAAALSQENIRRVLPVGVAAGIAAAFNAPIAAVTFTIEEVVGDLDQTVLSGVIVAAAIAAAVERSILGEHPVFDLTESYGLHHAGSLVFYALLGIAAGGVSLVFSGSLLWLRAWFGRLKRVPLWARPAIGGLVTGVLAFAAVYFFSTGGVTGGGYATLGSALSGSMPIKLMAFLCVVKIVSTVFSYGSGGAGGIFAPALFIGGMLGGVIGYLDTAALSHADNEVGAFALVGMGAVFAGIIRAPITSVLIIFEMTGSYGLILPLMISNMTAYAIARRYRPHAIYDELLEQDGIFLSRSKNQGPHAIEQVTVGETMTTDVRRVPAEQSLEAALESMEGSPFAVFPVTDNSGRCLGIVTRERLRREIASGTNAQNVRDVISPAVFVFPDEALSKAIVRMNESRVIKLFVVERKSRNKLVGILTMSDVVRAQANIFDGQRLEWSRPPNR